MNMKKWVLHGGCPGVTAGNQDPMRRRAGWPKAGLSYPGSPGPHLTEPSQTSPATAATEVASSSTVSGADWKSGEGNCLSIILATLLSNIFQSTNQQTLQKSILCGSTRNTERFLIHVLLIHYFIYPVTPSAPACLASWKDDVPHLSNSSRQQNFK